MGGVFKSWAVPKGPSFSPTDKRLAVMVPDHSLKYGSFEGTLEEGTYGAGEVRIWDDGKYETGADPLKQLERGKINVTFFGLKMRGEFVLAKMHRQENNWLLIKVNDQFADPDWVLETVMPKKEKSKTRSIKR